MWCRLQSYIWQRKVIASKNNEILIEGKRNEENGLYYFNLNGRKERVNYIVPNTISNKLTRFLHGALFSLTNSTLKKAIKKTS